MVQFKNYIFCIIFCTIFYTPYLYAPDFEVKSLWDKSKILRRLLSNNDLINLEALLREYPQYVDITDSADHSLLHIAIFAENKEAVQLLISLGADVNLRHPQTGNTSLHYSSNPEITQMLVDHPEIDLNARNKLDFTPLMLQIWDYRYLTAENIRILLAAGVKVDLSTYQGSTALYILLDMRNKHYQDKSISEREQLREIILTVANDLINYGADVNARSIHGVTPLHLAARMDFAEAVRLLVRHDAEMNVKEKDYGRTPMHFALGNEHALNALEALINLGADWNIPNQKGFSVKEILTILTRRDPHFRYQRILALRSEDSQIPPPSTRSNNNWSSNLGVTHRCQRALTYKQRKQIRNKRARF